MLFAVNRYHVIASRGGYPLYYDSRRNAIFAILRVKMLLAYQFASKV